MQKLNLPPTQLKIQEQNNQRMIFDRVRRKWVLCTPEEWVRQNIIDYMVSHRGYPIGLISVEHPFELDSTKRYRADIVVFNKSLHPTLIVECKAPTVKLTKETMEQICRYNLKLQAGYLVVTNGIQHFAFYTSDHKSYHHLSEFPCFETIISQR